MSEDDSEGRRGGGSKTKDQVDQLGFGIFEVPGRDSRAAGSEVVKGRADMPQYGAFVPNSFLLSLAGLSVKFILPSSCRLQSFNS